MWLETPLGERFSDLRVEQAFQTGAAVLGTACPFCVTCLEDSLKGQGVVGLADGGRVLACAREQAIEEALILAPQSAAKVGKGDLFVEDELIGGLYGSSHRLLSKIAQICLIGRG